MKTQSQQKGPIMKTSKDTFVAFGSLTVLFFSIYVLILLVDKFDISKGELIAGFFYIVGFSLIGMFLMNSAYNVKK